MNFFKIQNGKIFIMTIKFTQKNRKFVKLMIKKIINKKVILIIVNIHKLNKNMKKILNNQHTI